MYIKKKGTFFLIDVFFDIEFESEIRFCHSHLVFKINGKNYKNYLKNRVKMI